MKNKIDWTNHLVELIVVFIGISAAFALNNWNEARKEKINEKKYLENLIEENNTNITAINLSIEKCIKDSSQNEKALQLLFENENDIKEILPLIGRMSSITNIDARLTTYESIKFSGGLEIISNFELRNKIVDTYEYYDQVKIVENVTYNFIEKYWLEYIMEKFELTNKNIVSNNYKIDNDFKNIIASYKGSILQQLNTYRELLKKCEKLKIALEKEIS